MYLRTLFSRKAVTVMFFGGIDAVWGSLLSVIALAIMAAVAAFSNYQPEVGISAAMASGLIAVEPSSPYILGAGFLVFIGSWLYSPIKMNKSPRKLTHRDAQLIKAYLKNSGVPEGEEIQFVYGTDKNFEEKLIAEFAGANWDIGRGLLQTTDVEDEKMGIWVFGRHREVIKNALGIAHFRVKISDKPEADVLRDLKAPTAIYCGD